jgi:hypothetical protein
MNSIAQAIGVSREALEQKFNKTEGPELVRRRRIKATPAKLDKASIENQKLQDNFLSLMLMRRTLREFLKLVTEEMMYTDNGRELLAFLKQNPTFDGKRAVVQNLSDYVKIQAVVYEELYQGLELNELHYEAARLQARLIENFIKRQKAMLAQQLETAGTAQTRDLLTQAKQYDELLNQVKGATHGQS